MKQEHVHTAPITGPYLPLANNESWLLGLSNNAQAAEFLGISPETLKQSRWTGLLFGVPAPHFIKSRRKVQYQNADLVAWVQRLPKYRSNAEADAVKQ